MHEPNTTLGSSVSETLPTLPPRSSQACRPPKSALARVSRPPRDRSKEEAGDSYSGALFPIPGTKWRVAVDRAGYQWMLQHREAKDHWVSRKFFSNKKRLGTVVREMFPNTWQKVAPKIVALPI
jgi:hypothetical protein